MERTLAPVIVAVFVVQGACGPSAPADSASSTELTGPDATSGATPTTTAPALDIGAEDLICPPLPPLTVGDCVPTMACPETKVFTGDVAIVTAADVAGLACVHEIRGDLEVWDAALEHFAGLERLERVRGSIRISTNEDLASLDGLCGLRAVLPRMDGTGGDLEISFNFKLADVSGLAGLEQVAGSLRIRDNPALVSTRGLVSLTTVGASLEVRANSALESLRGLDRLEAGGEVEIIDNDALVDLCGLHGLTVVDSFNVLGNRGLRTLWGAHNLEHATIRVDIGGNDGLVDLTGLRRLSDVPRLDVRRNGGLQSLAGLDALGEVGTLALGENDAMVNWQAPAKLSAVQHLEICGNDGLTSLGVTALAVDRLTVIYNDLLGDAAGESYAAALGVTMGKIARNSPPPYAPLSPCPWFGDGICDEEDTCFEWACVYCNHNDCCGHMNPTALCALDTDAPQDCPGPLDLP